MSAILSIMMLTALALVAGAIYLWRNGGTRLQITLMLVLAVVIAGNVVLWGSAPNLSGPAPQGQVR
jgi:hypothetical protein